MRVSTALWAKSALLALAIGAYTAAAGEIFVRCFAPQPVMPRYVEATPAGVRGNIPHSVYRHFTPETDVVFRINAAGMRDDREYTVAKPQNTCRIELYGDSFFMGYELNFPDTIAARFEDALNQSGYRVQVLNFAVSGSGTAEQWLAFQSQGRNYQPDVVIFEWHSSTFMNNLRSQLFRLEDGRLARWRERYLPATEMQKALSAHFASRIVIENSELYALVRERLSTFFAHVVLNTTQATGRDVVATPVGDLPAMVAPPPALALSRPLVEAARDEVDKTGAGFMLVDIPMKLRDGLRETVDLLALDPRIAVVRPAGELLAADPSLSSLYYHRGMGHFAPRAAEIVARAMARELLGSDRLKACRREG